MPERACSSFAANSTSPQDRKIASASSCTGRAASLRSLRELKPSISPMRCGSPVVLASASACAMRSAACSRRWTETRPKSVPSARASVCRSPASRASSSARSACRSPAARLAPSRRMNWISITAARKVLMRLRLAVPLGLAEQVQRFGQVSDDFGVRPARHEPAQRHGEPQYLAWFPALGVQAARTRPAGCRLPASRRPCHAPCRLPLSSGAASLGELPGNTPHGRSLMASTSSSLSTARGPAPARAALPGSSPAAGNAPSRRPGRPLPGSCPRATEQIRHVERVHLGGRADGFGRLQLEPAGEHRQPQQGRPLWPGEQARMTSPPSPAKSGCRGMRVAAAAGEQPEPLVQAGRSPACSDIEDSRAAASSERERDPVQPSTDSRHQRCGSIVDQQTVAARPGGEQQRGIGAAQVLGGLGAALRQ